MPRLLTAVALALFATAVNAQQIYVPPGPYSNDSGCLVQGLDPNGDGFLALRAGPGTNYAQIGSLHNGDAAYLRKCEGRWCYVENGAIGGQEARFRGWIYTAWCQFYP
ncbi:SH3 domain-containing protein [Psychromarinibacter halotolerans]|uniref:SH3 domain-containing protein n=1 Tax=Psychromarinibacter halotolerans TaxID=1775175 RepID=A0ABV7GW79_9RHOB|nr:SH3 domain-containing protein [Psychromarinibacter halotolerans]MAQ84722.1 hypothetical protein [Maritimibacter sp.]MDF0596240.1 SH3 domain-containing protein [Psychromarinibacter halotolerans]